MPASFQKRHRTICEVLTEIKEVYSKSIIRTNHINELCDEALTYARSMSEKLTKYKQDSLATEAVVDTATDREAIAEQQTEWDATLDKIKAHIAKHDGKVQAPFSITGMKELVAEIDRLTRELAELREAAAATPEAKGEASYQAYRRAMAEESADEPADLPGTLRMLDEWGPDALPANESGQIHFARALLESAADAIRKHLATTAKEG